MLHIQMEALSKFRKWKSTALVGTAIAARIQVVLCNISLEHEQCILQDGLTQLECVLLLPDLLLHELKYLQISEDNI